jgi:ATP-binding cassette, subfamily A (ABC1), member 3
MYMLPIFTIVSLLVKEKESRARESMRMMGMTDFPYWLSWFVYYTLLSTVISVIAWATLCINVIRYSNPWLMLLFFWLYGQATFGQIIIMQSTFSRSKFSGLVSCIVYFGLILVYIPVKPNNVSRLTKFLTALIP